jgi:hypothetical protein
MPCSELIEERRRAPASPGAVDMSKVSLSAVRGIQRPSKLGSSAILKVYFCQLLLLI